jgi:hypothetical protein
MTTLRNPSRPKHSGRKRRVSGWSLLFLALLTFSAWLTSGWGAFVINTGHICIRFQYGLMVTDWYSLARSGPLTTWYPFRPLAEPTWQMWRWGDQYDSYTEPSGRLVEVPNFAMPGWLLPVLLTGAGVPFLRWGIVARRRARTGLCPACGYDMRGLTDGVRCPECGKG